MLLEHRRLLGPMAWAMHDEKEAIWASWMGCASHPYRAMAMTLVTMRLILSLYDMGICLTRVAGTFAFVNLACCVAPLSFVPVEKCAPRLLHS